jgi:hypothetical protein
MRSAGRRKRLFVFYSVNTSEWRLTAVYLDDQAFGGRPRLYHEQHGGSEGGQCLFLLIQQRLMLSQKLAEHRALREEAQRQLEKELEDQRNKPHRFV